MKAAIKALLASVGLAPAAQLERAAAQARHAADKGSALEDRLVAIKADVANWKHRYEEQSQAVTTWKQAAAHANEKTERARADAVRAEQHGQAWKTRADAFEGQVRDLRTRLQEANRSTASAREHLMAMEVKLDLIEAAIHVLDTRTREAAVSRSAEGDAPPGSAST